MEMKKVTQYLLIFCLKKKGFKTDDEIDYEEYLKGLKENENKLSFDEFISKNYEFNFMKYILVQGQKYEEYVYKTLKQKYENCEDLQIVKYDENGYYREHHDSCCDDNEHCKEFIKRGGQ
jgi:hypothetical protein